MCKAEHGQIPADPVVLVQEPQAVIKYLFRDDDLPRLRIPPCTTSLRAWLKILKQQCCSMGGQLHSQEQASAVPFSKEGAGAGDGFARGRSRSGNLPDQRQYVWRPLPASNPLLSGKSRRSAARRRADCMNVDAARHGHPVNSRGQKRGLGSAPLRRGWASEQ